MKCIISLLKKRVSILKKGRFDSDGFLQRRSAVYVCVAVFDTCDMLIVCLALKVRVANVFS